MKTHPCIFASETGFAVGIPLTVSPALPSHQDAVIEALEIECAHFKGEAHQRKAMEAMIHFLESPEEVQS